MDLNAQVSVILEFDPVILVFLIQIILGNRSNFLNYDPLIFD